MKKIALITSTANYERHKDTIRAIHAKLKQMGGYALYVLTSYGIFFNESAYDKGEQSIYSLLDEVEFDGCIIDSNLGRDKLFKHIIDKLKAKKIPFVANNFGAVGVPSVVMDGYVATCEVIKHLINEHNCKKINLVCTLDNDSVIEDAVRGYKDTLKEYSITVEERRISYRAVSLSIGRELWNDFAKVDTRDADAIVCMHDVHSIGLCLELEEKGYMIPEDIILCSLIRSTNSVAFRPDISGVDRMDGSIAERSFELLIDVMNGKEVPLINYFRGKTYFGGSCGCSNSQDEMIAKKYQQLVISKVEAGNQIRRMMQYNDNLDEVSSVEEFAENLQKMFNGLNCSQYFLCLNKGAIDYIATDKPYAYPDNGKFFDDNMCAVSGYTERTGKINNVTFPVGQLLPIEVQEGDLILIYPMHHIEQVYGYLVFVNEYLPVDIYNYRICHESIASSMDNLHRQMVLRKSVDMLERLHMQDALTGLHNRYAWDRFSNDYISNEAYCVVYMDMDGLKKVNDRYGHLAGNTALQIVANSIRNSVRENDLVTRCGGDEFQVLSTNVDAEFWDNLQQVINGEIDRQIAEKSLPYTFGVSYGYCICNKEHPLSFEECCDRADALMYENKKMRKACRIG